MPWRRYALHLTVLFATLLCVQAPRFSRLAAEAGAPVFAPNRGYLDFDHGYYPAGKAIRTNPSTLYRGAVYDRHEGTLRLTAPARFVNLPLVAWLFVPLAELPLPWAETLWLLFNIGVALTCLLLLQERIAASGAVWRWAVTLAFVTSGPLMNALNLGQTTPLILLFLLLGERCLSRGRDGRAGLWLGLACLIKVPPLLFLPYFALRRRWLVLATAGAVLVATVGLSVVWYGWPLHGTYFDVNIRANAGAALAAHNCQSIDAFLARVSTDRPLWSWQTIALGGGSRTVKWLLLAGLAAACGWALKGGPRVGYPRMLVELAMVLCAGLVALPVSWVHYGMWLLPVAVLVGGARMSLRLPQRHWWVALVVVGGFLINLPVPPPAVIRRLGDQMWFRVAISHQLFGTVLFLGMGIAALRWSCDRREPQGGGLQP
ncbi:MAG: glycosyltransferase family 87 protein [Candidatus Binatia bacterium]